MRRRCVGLLVALLLLPGCWSRVEVNDLAVISMVAVDRAEDDSVRLYLQIVLPNRIRGPGAGGEAGGRTVHMISSSGQTVLDAVRKLQLRTPRQLFWAHANVILVGEALARKGMDQVEDFITRLPELRIHSQILVVRGDMQRAMMTSPALERVPADYIRELGREQAGLVMTVREFVRDRMAQGIDGVLPVLELVKAEDPRAAPDETVALRLGGAALFRDHRLVAWLDQREMRALMWLREEKTRGVISMNAPARGGQISLDIAESRVERQVTWQNRRPQIQIRIHLQAELEEITSPLDVTDEPTLRRIEAALSDYVDSLARSVLEHLREQSTDPAGFGQLIRRADSQTWMRLRPNWRMHIKELPVALEVRVDVARTGLTKQARVLPEEEIAE